MEAMSLQQAFLDQGYITDRSTLTALQLLMALQKPLLVEGPAGVGKTEVAKVLASALRTRLIRLQCYEGLDVNTALYEWNYQKQMMYIKLTEHQNLTLTERQKGIFGEDLLFRRPLLEALTDQDAPPVLLIDEVDRADEEFEAFLLEVLGEFQVTIPELGTIQAIHRPYVILTSNRTRELSDALRRRCLYQWMGYPDWEKEQAIIEAHLPGIEQRLAESIANSLQRIRLMSWNKTPGVAESLDWARALTLLHQGAWEEQAVQDTLGCVFKDQDDWVKAAEYLAKGELVTW